MLKKFNAWWTEFWVNPNVGWMVVFAFLSAISFFQINSYWADKNNFNGLAGWLGLGIVFGLIAIYFLIRTYKTSEGRGG